MLPYQTAGAWQWQRQGDVGAGKAGPPLTFRLGSSSLTPPGRGFFGAETVEPAEAAGGNPGQPGPTAPPAGCTESSTRRRV